MPSTKQDSTQYFESGMGRATHDTLVAQLTLGLSSHSCRIRSMVARRSAPSRAGAVCKWPISTHAGNIGESTPREVGWLAEICPTWWGPWREAFNLGIKLHHCLVSNLCPPLQDIAHSLTWPLRPLPNSGTRQKSKPAAHNPSGALPLKRRAWRSTHLQWLSSLLQRWSSLSLALS